MVQNEVGPSSNLSHAGKPVHKAVVASMQPLKIINARITYKNAPIHELERFTFKDLDNAHRSFLEKLDLKECVILQTCNRVEIFAAGKNPDENLLIEHWALSAGMPAKEFTSGIETSKGRDAIIHLMKLASGLDSMVIGEDQILGQVKRAFEFSRKNRYAGSGLSVIFDRAVKVGSRVRTATGINRGSVSIGSVAVNLADEYFDDLKKKKIMLIGTGEGAALVAKALNQRDVSFMIASRAFERAKSFSETVAGVPITFERAREMFHEVDLIFVSTTAPYYLVTHDRIKSAMRNRKGGRGIMIFDLSNPRTVEDKVAAIPKVKLINMDQIGEIVEKNMRSRSNEVCSAEKMIDKEMDSVNSLMKRMKAEPAIVSVFKSVDTIRERELKKALSKLGKRVGPDESRVIEQLSYAIVEGILSTPMNSLRKEIETGEESNEELMKVFSRLFNYDEKDSQQKAQDQ